MTHHMIDNTEGRIDGILRQQCSASIEEEHHLHLACPRISSASSLKRVLPTFFKLTYFDTVLWSTCTAWRDQFVALRPCSLSRYNFLWKRTQQTRHLAKSLSLWKSASKRRQEYPLRYCYTQWKQRGQKFVATTPRCNMHGVQAYWWLANSSQFKQ